MPSRYSSSMRLTSCSTSRASGLRHSASNGTHPHLPTLTLHSTLTLYCNNNSLLPKGGDGCQMLLFSATFDKDVQKFAEGFVPEPKTSILLQRKEMTREKIAEFFIDCDNELKRFDILSDLYCYLTVSQSIIFVEVPPFSLKRLPYPPLSPPPPSLCSHPGSSDVLLLEGFLSHTTYTTPHNCSNLTCRGEIPQLH